MGDLLLTTDNSYVVDSVYHGYPITYQKNASKEQVLNFNNFANMDVKSFYSKIGFITNLASTLIAMLSNFPKDSEEYKEIKRRIDLLRFYQGVAIDSAKGDVFIPPPKHWSKKRRYIQLEELSESQKVIAEEENKKIQFNNKICGDKKPYFFGYVYPKLLKEQKIYRNRYNQIAKHKFGKSLISIMQKQDKSDEEKSLIRKYRRYSPLMSNNCIMNVLSRYIENAELDNKWNKNTKTFDYTCLLSGKYDIDNKELIRDISVIIKEFNRSQRINTMNRNYSIESTDNEDEYNDVIFEYLFEYYENKLLSLCSNKQKLSDYVVFVFYNNFKNQSKSLLWNVFGEEILNSVKNKSNKACFPIKDEFGEDYLGEKYSLRVVNYPEF